MAETVLAIDKLVKTYPPQTQALKGVSLQIAKGEIFGLLGKNGAGKTTMIESVCGLVRPTSGTILVFGHNAVTKPMIVRKRLGLVPQEVHLDGFMTVIDSVRMQRGFFGLPKNEAVVKEVLESLRLWEHREKPGLALSGGMKRRLLIAKALVHEPELLFLDEPTAGVDVELRQDLWSYVRTINQRGTTILLTTHYIEEAQRLADRIGIIDKGELLVVAEKAKLMADFGKKHLIIHLRDALTALPAPLAALGLSLRDPKTLEATYSTSDVRMPTILATLQEHNVSFVDLETERTSLEEIFVGFTENRK